jgi:hypothetical protein
MLLVIAEIIACTWIACGLAAFFIHRSRNIDDITSRFELVIQLVGATLLGALALFAALQQRK